MCGTENGTNGAAPVAPPPNNPATSVYSQVQDYLSNTGNFKSVCFTYVMVSNTNNRIQDHRKYVGVPDPVFQGHVNMGMLGTLREGEQFS